MLYIEEPDQQRHDNAICYTHFNAMNLMVNDLSLKSRFSKILPIRSGLHYVSIHVDGCMVNR